MSHEDLNLKKEVLYKNGLLGNEKTLSYFALRWAAEWLVDLSLKDDQRNDLFPLPWRMQWKWKLTHCVTPHRYAIIPIWILIPVLIIRIPEMSKCHRDFVFGVCGVTSVSFLKKARSDRRESGPRGQTNVVKGQVGVWGGNWSGEVNKSESGHIQGARICRSRRAADW